MKGLCKQNVFAVCLALVLEAGCDTAFSGYSTISVALPQGVNLSGEEIKAALERELPFDSEGPAVEITIYAYSSGKERLVYGQDGIISEKNEEGYIKLLLAFRQGNAIQKAVFIETENRGAGELILSIKREMAQEFFFLSAPD